MATETVRHSHSIVLHHPVESGGARLRGIYCASVEDRPVPVVVFAHGLGSTHWGEKARAYEEACASRGWSFLAVDFRGHGQSDGRISEMRALDWVEDLALMVREARSRAGGPVFLVGSSQGGWAAAWLSILQPETVAACALIAPALKLWAWLALSAAEREAWVQTGRHRIQTEYLDLELPSSLLGEAVDYPFETLLQRFHHPTILFHGMADAVIPASLSLDFAERCASLDLRLCLSKTGDHRLTRERHWLARESCHFFADWLGGDQAKGAKGAKGGAEPR
ncbi:MAG: alpha/beta hydrolase [Blastocatellia bacterium]|jgi:pimeloyl-ACP methyl ester carboxylesterase